jgi:TolB-like protein
MIAVLPFANPSGDADLDLLADALTDTVTSELQKLQGLSVISRGSAGRFRNSDRDIREVGRLLGANYIVEGKLRESGHTTRISAQMTDTATGEQLWAADFDKNLTELSNYFALYDEVSKTLLLQLQSVIDVRHHAFEISGPPTESLEAYMLWRESQLKMQEGRYRSALPFLEKATTVDAEFAAAYSSIALTKWMLAEIGFLPFTGYLEAREAAQRAIEIDSKLGLAYLILARLASRIDLDFFQAMKLLEKAEQFDAPPEWVASAKGELFLNTGRYEEGLVQSRKAENLDPLNVTVKWETARMLNRRGRIAEASEKFQEVIDMGGLSRGYILDYTLDHYLDHDLDRAIEIIQEIADPTIVPPWAATLVALKQGNPQPHQDYIDRLAQSDDLNASAGGITWGNFRLGHYEEHIRWFPIYVQARTSLLYLYDAMYGRNENYWAKLEAWSEAEAEKSGQRKTLLREYRALVKRVMEKMVLPGAIEETDTASIAASSSSEWLYRIFAVIATVLVIVAIWRLVRSSPDP